MAIRGATGARGIFLFYEPTRRVEEDFHAATRQCAKAHYLSEIEHYLYAGDTALQIAAAAYRREIVRKLIVISADVRASEGEQ